MVYEVRKAGDRCTRVQIVSIFLIFLVDPVRQYFVGHIQKNYSSIIITDLWVIFQSYGLGVLLQHSNLPVILLFPRYKLLNYVYPLMSPCLASS